MGRTYSLSWAQLAPFLIHTLPSDGPSPLSQRRLCGHQMGLTNSLGDVWLTLRGARPTLSAM